MCVCVRMYNYTHICVRCSNAYICIYIYIFPGDFPEISPEIFGARRFPGDFAEDFSAPEDFPEDFPEISEIWGRAPFAISARSNAISIPNTYHSIRPMW